MGFRNCKKCDEHDRNSQLLNLRILTLEQQIETKNAEINHLQGLLEDKDDMYRSLIKDIMSSQGRSPSPDEPSGFEVAAEEYNAQKEEADKRKPAVQQAGFWDRFMEVHGTGVPHALKSRLEEKSEPKEDE